MNFEEVKKLLNRKISTKISDMILILYRNKKHVVISSSNKKVWKIKYYNRKIRTGKCYKYNTLT